MKSESAACPVGAGTNNSLLTDPFGRSINYLRLALTDRCNLRCRYCMPESGISLKDHDKILSFEELEQLITIFTSLGINKIRITGGEPFVRKGTDRFIEYISSLAGLEKIHITTNGVLNEQQLSSLNSAKIGGINISLDSLDAGRFQFITRRDSFNQTWNTINFVRSAGIPLKINMVVQKGINDDELIAFAELARDWQVDIRFIEFMPFNGSDSDNRGKELINAGQIRQKLEQAYPGLSEIVPQTSTARLFTIPGFAGRVGIIGGYSRTFCGSCNRLRLTADGQLKNCLYDTNTVDLKSLLRSGKSASEIKEAIRVSVNNRAVNGHQADLRSGNHQKDSMAAIGG